MSSKDIQLDLIKNLELLRAQKTDYLVICLEPGKNADRADVWYELKDPNSPQNLLEACLNLFTNLYNKDDLIDLLLLFCQQLDDNQLDELGSEVALSPPKKKRKNPPKQIPPDEFDEGEEGALV